MSLVYGSLSLISFWLKWHIFKLKSCHHRLYVWILFRLLTYFLSHVISVSFILFGFILSNIFGHRIFFFLLRFKWFKLYFVLNKKYFHWTAVWHIRWYNHKIETSDTMLVLNTPWVKLGKQDSLSPYHKNPVVSVSLTAICNVSTQRKLCFQTNRIYVIDMIRFRLMLIQCIL